MYFKFLLVALLAVAAAAAANMPKSAVPKMLKIRGGGDDDDASDIAQKAGSVWLMAYGLVGLVAPDALNKHSYDKDCASEDSKLTMRYAGLFATMVGLMGSKLPKADAFKMFALTSWSIVALSFKALKDEIYKDKLSAALSSVMALTMTFFAKKNSD